MVHITKNDRETLQSIKQKIEMDFKEDIHYSDLVKQFHINDSKLRNGFEMLYGTSIRNYQERLRIDYSISLMQKDEDLSMTEIAYACGYKDPSTFYRAFNRVKNTTPGNYKTGNQHNGDFK